MLYKLEHFIKHLRSKAFFFDQKNDECFGFKSEKTPPQHEKLIAFEEDFYALVKSIKFSNRRNQFQSNLINEVKKIKESHNLIVSADKTTNLYEMSVNNTRSH